MNIKFMKRVVLESPYSENVERNVSYAKMCMRDAIVNYNEAPLALHLLYTQILDDNIFEERTKGMYAGFCWTSVAEKCVVYCDYGISGGMKVGIEMAQNYGLPIEYRCIYKNI